MTDYTPEWYFQVGAGCVLLLLAYVVRMYSLDPEQVAVSTGFALSGVASMVPTFEVWWIGLAGAGFALVAFPLGRYRMGIVVLAFLLCIWSDARVLRPTYGTDRRVLASSNDVPGVPMTYARPNYMKKSAADFDRGRAELLGYVVEAITETFGEKAGEVAAATPNQVRKTPMVKTFESKISKSFDLKPMTAEELEHTRQSQTSGTLRESPAIVTGTGILDPR